MTIKYYITYRLACFWDPNNSLVKMNLNLLTTTSRQRCGDFVPTLALIWVESYSVVYQGWLKASFLQLVGNMISRGASGNPLFRTKKSSYTQVYMVNLKEKTIQIWASKLAVMNSQLWSCWCSILVTDI